MNRVTGIGRWAGVLALVLTAILAAATAQAAPGKAQVVMDMRTGEVLYARSADQRLHPASLTKMMTLYVAFEALKNGEIREETMVRISKFAASEPPIKIYLRPGQRIQFQYLLRAAAVKSANDAATAIAEAVSGSESAFAARMNQTAKRLGMKNSHFKNAHGLTESGHLSTARDMAILGRHLRYDFPGYWGLFSRKTAFVGVTTVQHTNRKLLNGYTGADGLKTGYTSAAGWNLVATAKRGEQHILVSVFGERSPTERHIKVTKLLDLGFREAPRKAAVIAPKPTKLSTKMSASPRPSPRPLPAQNLPEMPPAEEQVTPAQPDLPAALVALSRRPAPRPDAAPKLDITIPAPPPKPDAPEDLDVADLRVVTRATRETPQTWTARIGPFASGMDAESAMLRINLSEGALLKDAGLRMQHRREGVEIVATALTESRAEGLCKRLTARAIGCQPEAPNPR